MNRNVIYDEEDKLTGCSYIISDLGRDGVLLSRREDEDYWVLRIGIRHNHRGESRLPGALRWGRYLIDADKASELSLKRVGLHVQGMDDFDWPAVPLILPVPGGNR